VTILQRLVHKPRTFAARGWLFQIHLWVGVILALYAVLIGITGSALVFYPQMRNWQDQDVLTVPETGARLNPDQILASVRAFQPGVHIMSMRMPVEPQSTYRISTGQMGRGKEIYVHPFTAQVLAVRVPRNDFLAWLQRLHFDLLSGKTGRLVNAVGGLLMVVLAITGIVIWWPGKALWVRAASINWRAKWKRLNYDLHSAIGFFSMIFAVLISLTGAYYGWPKETQELLSRFSPVVQKAPAPKLPKTEHPHELPLNSLLAIANQQVPHAWVSTIGFAHQHGQPLRFTLLEAGPRQYQWSNAVFIDPATGKVLRVDTVAGRSLGDAIIAWIPPLHFGSFAGGNYVATLWLLLGLTPAILGMSGLLMWWNRVLVKKVWRWRTTGATAGDTIPVSAMRTQNR
jgi:uncharacterized iron-regulated membrane protein